MFNTGFTMNASANAEDMDGKSIQWLAKIAGEKGSTICGSMIIREKGKFYNRLIWMKPDGSFLYYDKKHLFRMGDEQLFFAAGERKLIVELKGWKIMPLVCYDLRFPELFRVAATTTDLFVVIANWPERRAHAWRTLLAARAIDDQAWILGVNRIGEVDGYDHSGDTSLLDPWGMVVATLADETGVVSGEIDPAVVRRARERFLFLADRRPDLYRRLEDED